MAYSCQYNISNYIVSGKKKCTWCVVKGLLEKYAKDINCQYYIYYKQYEKHTKCVIEGLIKVD